MYLIFWYETVLTLQVVIVPLESRQVNGIEGNIARPRMITSLHQAANTANKLIASRSADSNISWLVIARLSVNDSDPLSVDAATANVGSKSTTSTNTFGTSGSDVSNGGSDSSYTEAESGNGTGTDTSATKSWAMQGACAWKILTSLVRQCFRESSCPCWTPK